MKCIIIHGAYGNPQENWFPWLIEKLKGFGHIVDIPKFPTPENQNLESWKKIIEGYDLSETVVIAHSLGCAFILALLENVKAKACFFVAPFVGKLGISFDDINKTIAERDFDWNRISKNCEKFSVYYSDDDPYVPSKKGKEIVENLDCEFKVIKGAGHFNAEAGYTKFEMLYDDIMKLSDVRKGRYKHFKGKEYRVLGVAYTTSDKSPMVVYQGLYSDPEFGDHPIWARPKEDFLATKQHDGKDIERFRWLG